MASPKTKSPLPKRALCQKALRPEEPRSKHAKHPPPSFQRCSTYTQQWFTLKGGASLPPGQFPAEDNERSVAVSIPDGKPPAEGWPVILYPSFMNKTTAEAEGWSDSNPPSFGGLTEDADPEDEFGRAHLQDFFHRLVQERRYALVMPAMWAYDVMFYLPDDGATSWGFRCNGSSREFSLANSGCWHGGENPDVPLWGQIFDALEEGEKGAFGLRFNTKRIGVVAYSVGTHWTSRLLNEAARGVVRTPAGRAYPELRAAVLIAGGSYFCYAYFGEAPAAFRPCSPRFDRDQCCPRGMTEAAYDSGERAFGAHPPVFLLQTADDSYASPEASTRYFDALTNGGGPACLLRTFGDTHGMTREMVGPAFHFVSSFV